MNNKTITLTPTDITTALQSRVDRAEQQVAVIESQTAKFQPPDVSISSVSALPAAAAGLPGRASAGHQRNGKIARLPKLERDMVNRLLHNHVPYPNIVDALDERGIQVTQRNISNWKTRGGYKEWCAEQERQINLSRLQDNMVDYLRKNDAGQLPEVGLQVAATQLTSMLLQPDAVRQLTAEPEKYSKVMDMLCRLSTHIQSLQKDRNETVKKASSRHSCEFIKHEEEKSIEKLRLSYASKPGKGPRDPDSPHRNELPKRDVLPFREPSPEMPGFMEILEQLRRKPGSNPSSPAGPQTC